VSEALVFGKKAGVDPEAIFNAIRGGLPAVPLWMRSPDDDGRQFQSPASASRCI
jgi:hypothetical protein